MDKIEWLDKRHSIHEEVMADLVKLIKYHIPGARESLDGMLYAWGEAIGSLGPPPDDKPEDHNG